MNQTRKQICIAAFKKLDISGDGLIDITDIKVKYNAKKHPDVMMNKRTEDEVLYDFLDTFEANYSLNHPESHDHTITLDEWIDYYNNVSCNIDNDEYFQIMMVNAFGLK